MGSLKTLFGAAAVAANMAGASDAQDLQSGIVTRVNGVEGRSQLYDLPDVVLPNFVVSLKTLSETQGTGQP